MTTKLELFTSPSAFPNPQRLRLFMHEKGIADHFEEHVYDMSPVGEQRQWRHLKMNPWGETPTLKLADGSYLAETAAIVRFLDQSMPGRKIMGETALEQGLSADFLLIQVTSTVGNDKDSKLAFFRFIADELKSKLSVRPDDIMINMVYVDRSDWSFGNGEPWN